MLEIGLSIFVKMHIATKTFIFFLNVSPILLFNRNLSKNKLNLRSLLRLPEFTRINQDIPFLV